jgi:hypothetical protein
MTGDNRSLVASARKGSAWPRTTRTLIASSLHEHRSISKVLLCQPTAPPLPLQGTELPYVASFRQLSTSDHSPTHQNLGASGIKHNSG